MKHDFRTTSKEEPGWCIHCDIEYRDDIVGKDCPDIIPINMPFDHVPRDEHDSGVDLKVVPKRTQK